MKEILIPSDQLTLINSVKINYVNRKKMQSEPKLNSFKIHHQKIETWISSLPSTHLSLHPLSLPVSIISSTRTHNAMGTFLIRLSVCLSVCPSQNQPVGSNNRLAKAGGGRSDALIKEAFFRNVLAKNTNFKKRPDKHMRIQTLTHSHSHTHTHIHAF